MRYPSTSKRRGLDHLYTPFIYMNVEVVDRAGRGLGSPALHGQPIHGARRRIRAIGFRRGWL